MNDSGDCTIATSHPVPLMREAVAARLRELGACLFACGQSPLWDEPTKAAAVAELVDLVPGLCMVAGVHDSDYFSKLPNATGAGFRLVPRTDASTAELWAATAEFSALFGSETPVRVRDLAAQGVPIRQLARSAPEGPRAFLDRVTEAWHWRGVVAEGDSHTIAADMPADRCAPAILAGLDWALQASLGLLDEQSAQRAAVRAEEVREEVVRAFEHAQGRNLPAAYQRILLAMWAGLLGQRPGWLRLTTTLTEFRFHPGTCDRPRFAPVNLYLDPRTADLATHLYDEAVAGTGAYKLHEFGEGALPFELAVPGAGRGTIHVTHQAASVSLPQGEVQLGAPAPRNTRELAALVEARFGRRASLVGKALMGPVLMSREWVMILNETASNYVPRTRWWVQQMEHRGVPLHLNPILRVRFHALDALATVQATFHLPDHLAHVFNQPELTGPELAAGWRPALDRAEVRLKALRHTRSNLALLQLWAAEQPQTWARHYRAYRAARDVLRAVGADVQARKGQMRVIADEVAALEDRARELEALSGGLRRQRMKPLGDQMAALRLETPERADELAELEAQWRRVKRQQDVFQQELADVRRRLRERQAVWTELRDKMVLVARSDQARQARDRIAELDQLVARERLRQAMHLLRCRGLAPADVRPAAWWFRLLQDSGDWFGAVRRHLELYFEEFSAQGD